MHCRYEVIAMRKLIIHLVNRIEIISEFSLVLDYGMVHGTCTSTGRKVRRKLAFIENKSFLNNKMIILPSLRRVRLYCAPHYNHTYSFGAIVLLKFDVDKKINAPIAFADCELEGWYQACACALSVTAP